MKNLKYEEHRAKYQDADGDEQESVVTAAVVGKDNVGDVVQTRDSSRTLREGDVVVETSTPGVYDVHDKDGWAKLGYSTGRAGTPDSADESTSDDGPDNPPDRPTPRTGARGRG